MCKKKALKIYDKLFTCPPLFYNKAIDTNNAIVIEIAERGGLIFLEASRYLIDSVTKKSNPILLIFKIDMKNPKIEIYQYNFFKLVIPVFIFVWYRKNTKFLNRAIGDKKG